MPSISIIIPVYNCVSYLSCCIESVLKQTFRDFELLLIDDGSSDGSGDICDAFMEKDLRIRVFHKANEGVSLARNVGIYHACSDWITFIDADDFIGDAFLRGLYSPIEENEKVEFVHGGCMNFKRNHKPTINQQYDYLISNDKNILFSSFRGLIVSKLFKTKILKENSLQFDESMRIAEDMAFTMDYLLYVDYYAFVPEISYYYRRDNNNSATHKSTQICYSQSRHDFLHLYDSTLKFIKKNKISIDSAKIRYEQRATHFMKMVLSMYYDPSFNRIKRHKSFRNELEPYIYLLKYLNKKSCFFLLSRLLINRHYKIFDIFVLFLIKVKRVMYLVL